DGGGGTERASEDHSHCRCEHRVGTNQPEGMPDVGGEVLERADGAGLSNPLGHLRDSAKRDTGIATGHVGSGAASDACGDVLVDMKRQLVVEFPIGAFAAE